MHKLKLLLLFFSISIAYADDSEMRKYRNFTPQQINDLSDDERKSKVPMGYLQAANTGSDKHADLFFGMQLNKLMYPGLYDYSVAIRAYQSDLGESQTGVLSVGQIYDLNKRYELQGLSRVLFPSQYMHNISSNHAFIEGTMIIVDEKIAWPINHIKIACYKSQNYCRQDEIDLELPDQNSWTGSYQVIQNDPVFYDITKWSVDSIDGASRDTESSCRTTTVNFNFKTKEFYYTTRNSGGKCDILGVSIPRLAKPRIAQIIDGSKVIQEEFAKIDKLAFDMLSSDFKIKVAKIQAENKK